MPKLSPLDCYYRCLEMFHAEGGPEPQHLNTNDTIEGPLLGYTPLKHRALSNRINKKYFADVDANTTPAKVQKQKTIGDLSDYIFTTLPAGNKLVHQQATPAKKGT